MTKLEQLEQDVAFAKFDYEETDRAVAVKLAALQAKRQRYNTLAAVVDALDSEEDAHIVLEAVRIRELERLNAPSKATGVFATRDTEPDLVNAADDLTRF